MEKNSFTDRLVDLIIGKESILCVGLDPQLRYFPKHILREAFEKSDDKSSCEPAARAIVEFNEAIIDKIAPFTAVVKPQRAFYEQYGHWGIWALEETIQICKQYNLLVLEDAKRSDGGDTAKAYSDGHLGKVDVWSPGENALVKTPSLAVDAMTVMPWIGTSCLKPFLEEVKSSGKGIFLVVKTSFTPNSEIEQIPAVSGRLVWEETASLVKEWSKGCKGKKGFNNVGVVVGATYPKEGEIMRGILPDCFFLVPGYGAQGGGAEGAIKGIREDGLGIIVNSSRSIDYAYLRRFKCDSKYFAGAAGDAAEAARNDLNQALKKANKTPW